MTIRFIGRVICQVMYMAIGLAAFLGFAASAVASGNPLFIEDSVRLALEREPGEVALRRRSQALTEDATAAGQLADNLRTKAR